MFSKVLSSMIIIVVLYILGIFLAPVFTDSIGDMLGIASVNTKIREFKWGVDSTSDTLLQIKDASGAISGVKGVVDRANNQIQETNQLINTKGEQLKKAVDSIEKVKQSVDEAKSNISELTTFSGTVSRSWTTLSGATKSGSGK